MASLKPTQLPGERERTIATASIDETNNLCPTDCGFKVGIGDYKNFI